MKTINLFLLILFGLLSTAYAQSEALPCNQSYTRSDRATLLEARPDEAILQRLAELAEQSASALLSQTQRMALSAEFQALLQEIGNSTLPLDGVSKQTNVFLSELLDTEYLGIADLTIIGDTTEESQMNSRQALDALNSALGQYGLCLAGSWERVEVTPSRYSPRCAGGYPERGFRPVIAVTIATSRVLHEMSEIAAVSAEGVFSVNQRAIMQLDYEFQTEEIEVLSNQFVSRTRGQTALYIQEVIDSNFLGVANTQIAGQSIGESQANAQRALRAINRANYRLLRCFAR